MKVFLDTNIWLSGRFRPGLCAELLDALVEIDATLLLDERVLEEFTRIARDKLKVDEPGSSAEAYPTDPDDAWILAAALSAQAELFVTGDKPLLALGTVEGLPLVDPRTAYSYVRGLV
ncbi:MAG: putative toxin-antitoxin system toxin component, PIN family [Thiohalorhabdaceae bacterium]